MESLINQMRVRFYGAGQENKEETGSIRDRRLPPQKTQSFKGEKKKSPNWLQRRFSWQMSRNNDSSVSMEYPTAIAAAAFAVRSLESQDQKKMSGRPDTFLTKTKSKTEDTTTPAPEPRTVSIKLSDEASSSAIEVPDKQLDRKASAAPERTVRPAPSIKKTPTFADKQLDRTASARPESAALKPDLPPTKQPAVAPVEVRQRPTRPGTGDSEADAWEKAEMAKIKERYEKLTTTIENWGNKKKTKAKNKLNTTEANLDKKRAKASQHYRSEIERINQIVGGAKAQAEENRRNKEFKAKERANKIRETGKLPATCLCF